MIPKHTLEKEPSEPFLVGKVTSHFYGEFLRDRTFKPLGRVVGSGVINSKSLRIRSKVKSVLHIGNRPKASCRSLLRIGSRFHSESAPVSLARTWPLMPRRLSDARTFNHWRGASELRAEFESPQLAKRQWWAAVQDNSIGKVEEIHHHAPPGRARLEGCLPGFGNAQHGSPRPTRRRE